MTNKENDIGRVLENYYQELENKCYAESTIAHYHCHAEKFRKWCVEHEIEKFSEDVAINYCTSQIGSYVFISSFSHQQKDELRVIRMIVGLERDGRFEIRGPQRDFKYNALIAFINGHIERYVEKKHPSLSSLQDRKRDLEQFDEFLSSKNIELQYITPKLLEEFFLNEEEY